MTSTVSEIEARLLEIHRDFEANVIGHNVDSDVMFAVDLAFHSVNQFEFQGRLQKKGVVEVLILGDTRIGKTAVSENLIDHFRRGELISCENISISGMFAGVDDMGDHNRIVRSGKLPLRHGELVVLDEANELHTDMISKLSGVRSSGVYHVIKIVHAAIPCRVRLIWIANPKGKETISEMFYGVKAIEDVIGKPEDIARFDLAVVLGKRDVDLKALYVESADKPKVKHEWVGERCRKLIDWVWSRKPNEVVIPPETERAILEWSEDFSGRYSQKIPLVIDTEQRIKLARLSIACAARLGSSTDDAQKIVVRPAHVHVVCRRLQKIYGRQSMLYDKWSDSVSAKDLGPEVDRVVQALGQDGVGALLNIQVMSKTLLQDIFSDKDAGAKAWSDLLTGQAIRNGSRNQRYMAENLIDKIKKERATLAKRPNPSLLKSGIGEE